MHPYPEKIAELLELLALTPDRADRIQILIDIADRFRGVPETVARRPYDCEHRVPACESEAYVYPQTRPDGTLQFHIAVENPQGISAKALAVILDEALSGLPASEVARVPRDFVHALFGNELSMGKSMGLLAMVSMVRQFAKRHLDGAAPA